MSIVLFAVIVPVAVSTIWFAKRQYDAQLDSALTIESQANALLRIRIEAEVERLKTLLLNKTDPMALLFKQTGKSDIQSDLLSWFALIAEREETILELLVVSTEYDVIAAYDPGFGAATDLLLSAQELQSVAKHWDLDNRDGYPEVSIPSLNRVHVGSPKPHEGLVAFTISVPIGNPVEAALIAKIDIGRFWQNPFYQEHGAGHEKARDYILDRNGMLLTEIDGSEHQLGDLMTHLSLVRTAPMDEEWASDKPYVGVINQAVYGTTTSIPSLDWTLVSEVIVSEIRNPILGELLVTAIGGLLVMLVFGFVALLLTKMTLDPLRQVSAAIERVAKGDFRIDLKPSRILELNFMMNAFSKMAVQREQAETELKRLSAAIEQSASLIMITDTKGTIEYINSTFSKVSGYSAAEALGENRDFQNREHQGALQNSESWETALCGEFWKGELENWRKDGTAYFEVATIFPIKNKADEIVSLCKVSRNVSRERELEQQLRLDQKLETIGTLAGGIAHDFNNILAPVLGYTDMAMSRLEETDPLYEELQNVLEGGLRAKELVQKILLFAKTNENEMEPLQLESIVEAVLVELQPRIPTSVKIRKHIDASCKEVFADSFQMEQVVINLCTNAWDAMEAKGGELTIEVKPVTLGPADVKSHPNLPVGEYVQLSVADTGVGMDRKTLDRVFEPFYTTKQVGEGTGLGLSVVYGIVRGHLGDVIAESKLGEGSAFHVYLPVSKAAGEARGSESKPIVGGQESILIVDDDVVVANITTKILQHYGYGVQVCSSSLEALSVFRENPEGYDLLISDLTMANITGMDLSKKIQSIRSGFPSIVMAGYADDIIEDERRASGVRKIISKPVLMDELAMAVRDVLDKSNIEDNAQ